MQTPPIFPYFAIQNSNMNIPLAERMRPSKLVDYIGQEHILGENSALLKSVQKGFLPSCIFWGPPGVGKTSLAYLLAKITDRQYFVLSAINSGVKDLREAIEMAGILNSEGQPTPVLFIDEIHRFNKAQQDALLGAVERGTIILIGATTENPSFEVIAALLSRCQVYILEPLQAEQLKKLVDTALELDEFIKNESVTVSEYEELFRLSGGDARKLYNALELVIQSQHERPLIITNKLVANTIQSNLARYDKSGEQHYDIISAFIKSVRGSDPNGSVYWLARMLHAGEDVKFIARRLIILASEDIGLANPNALLLAQSCFDAVHKIGMPEARIILSQTTIYMATSAKSNSAYLAINQALEKVSQTGDLPVPLHLRNAPTKLMKEIGYGKQYKYSHDFEDNFADQQFLPVKISGTKFYKPAKNKPEQLILQRLQQFWKSRYGY